MIQLPVKPMKAELVESPHDGKFAYPFGADGWGFEVKWDGHRMIALVRPGQRAALFSSSGRIVTPEYAEIAERLADLSKEMVLDGEVVVIRDGRPNRQALSNARRMTKDDRLLNLRYAVFDCLAVNGESIMDRPLEERQKYVAEQVAFDAAPMVMGTVSMADGEGLWGMVEEQRLEGLIAKPASSLYRPGQRGPWLKIKLLQRDVFVVVGFTAGDGYRAGSLGALVLARQTEQGLVYAGKVGTGFGWKALEQLDRQLVDLKTTEAPFDRAQLIRVKPKIGPRSLTWVRPEMRVEVEFSELSDDGIPTFPSFQGVVT